FVFPVEVRFRDLDALGHVNNAVYLTYLESARIAYALKLLESTSFAAIPFILAELTISYRKPAFLGEQLLVGVRVSRIGRKSVGMTYAIVRGEETVATASSTLVWFDYQANNSAPVPDSFRQAVEQFQGAALEG
ncbi:MAG: acyl-CoA thioesterase, partial [Chloroflexaceae bacterium]|nr:acyl-CoA thioesterase [Chloroflexaceae bacterium]